MAGCYPFIAKKIKNSGYPFHQRGGSFTQKGKELLSRLLVLLGSNVTYSGQHHVFKNLQKLIYRCN